MFGRYKCILSAFSHLPFSLKTFLRKSKETFSRFPFSIKTFALTEGNHDNTMDILIPRYPLHISENIISFLEFPGNYTREDLLIWAELNSYPYLKKKIAKRLSIVVYVQSFKCLAREYITEQNLKDETIGLLSRCTDSFFFLYQLTGLSYSLFNTSNMREDWRRHLELELDLSGDYYIIDVFRFFRKQLPPRRYAIPSRSREVMYSFEFMRLLKFKKCEPENMFVINKWPQKKYAFKALFFPSQLVPREESIIPDPLKPLGYNFVPHFTNPRCSELVDFADNLYIRQGFHCKKSFWKRLLNFLKIIMDRKHEERWLRELRS